MGKVRIRKALPHETPGYYNKTAMFLRKAEEGMAVQPEEAQGQEQQMMETYYQYAYQQLANEQDPEDVLNELVQSGLPQQVALQMISTLMDTLVEKGLINPDYKRNKEAKQEEEQQQAAQEAPQQEAAPQEPEQSEEEYMSMFDDAPDVTQAEEAYTMGTEDPYMAYGGEYDDEEGQSSMLDMYKTVGTDQTENFSLDDIIQNTPGIQPGLRFTSLSEYIPDMPSYEWSDVNSAEPYQDFGMEMQRNGGPVRKKQFVKNVMALLKKAEGGEGEEEKEDGILGRGNPMDTLTEDVKKHKANFLSAIKTKADTVKTEEMYDRLKKSADPALQKLGMQGASQQQQPMQPIQPMEQPEMQEQPIQPMQPMQQFGGYTGGPDPLFKFFGGGDNEDYYEEDFMPEASYGYSTGNLRRAQNGDGGKKKVTTEVIYTSPPTYVVKDENGNVLYDGPDITKANSFESGIKPDIDPGFTQGNGSGRDIDPGFNIDPATGRPFSRRKQLMNLMQQQQLLMQQGALQANTAASVDGVPRARINYVPNYVSGMGNSYRNLVPWNPIVQKKKFTVPMGSAYMYGTNTPYTDPLAGRTPIARQVTNRGIFGQDKGHTDIYEIPGAPDSNVGNITFDGDKLIFPERNTKSSPSLNLVSNPHGDQPTAPREVRFGPIGSTKGILRRGDRKAGKMPKASGGIEINNPNLPQPAPANPDIALATQSGLIGKIDQGPNTSWSTMQSFNQPAPTNSEAVAFNSNPNNNITTEPLGDDLTTCTAEQKRDTTSKCYCSPEARKDPKDKRCFEGGFAGLDYASGMSTTTDLEPVNNIVNAGMRGIAGRIGSNEAKAAERKLMQKTDSNANYAAQAAQKRGDHVDFGSGLGDYRPDDTGQDKNSFSSYGKYGGYMKKGGSANYNEGDEVYMTAEDIKNFRANGGQIEYI
jgi:hypothetical protein